MTYDVIVVGGGIVGLSTALQLKKARPALTVLVLEKEDRVAQHQTGHNSGVIHAGIYYEPGSLKAQFCKQGVEETIQFCLDNGISFEQCGKLIVATDDVEFGRLLQLHERAIKNKLQVELLNAAQLRELEPNIVGVGAIRLRTTGIVNYARICEKIGEQFERLGGEVRLGAELVALYENENTVSARLEDGTDISANYLVACAGLMADRVAKMLSIPIDFRIIPYRGEYYRLPDSKSKVINHLIYPVPNPTLPFLGVHLTRMIDGSITVGPNAVQGWKREGYGRFNLSLRDCGEMLIFPGFWKVSFRNLKTGLIEWRNSVWKRGYLGAVRKYCPSIELQDLQPYPAGIRAQAVLRNGTLVHDFLFAESPRSLHVCNAPSPAATSSIPIGKYVCEKILAKVG